MQVALVHAAVKKKRNIETYPSLSGVKPPHTTDVQQESPYTVVLKVVIYNLQRALLHELQHLTANFSALHSYTQVYRSHRRYIGCRSQYLAHYAAPVPHQLAEGDRVFVRALME